MILITLSAFLSVIVVNLYFHGARSDVPWIVRKVNITFYYQVLSILYYFLLPSIINTILLLSLSL